MEGAAGPGGYVLWLLYVCGSVVNTGKYGYSVSDMYAPCAAWQASFTCTLLIHQALFCVIRGSVSVCD